MENSRGGGDGPSSEPSPLVKDLLLTRPLLSDSADTDRGRLSRGRPLSSTGDSDPLRPEEEYEDDPDRLSLLTLFLSPPSSSSSLSEEYVETLSLRSLFSFLSRSLSPKTLSAIPSLKRSQEHPSQPYFSNNVLGS